MHNQLPEMVSSRIGCCIMLYWVVEVALVVEPEDVLAELLEMQIILCVKLDTYSSLFTITMSSHLLTPIHIYP